VQQPVHVVDAVRARRHAADQRHDLRDRERAYPVLRGRQVHPLGQADQRFQAAIGDQGRIIERGRDR
jgi:hypothetical protein